jgi:hypothetical protein
MQGPVTATQFKGEVSIQAQNGQYIPATMVFDSGGGTNLVNQRYALATGWTADASIPPPTNTHWGNGNNAYIHGAYNVQWKATNSWGKTQEQRTVFYGTELEGEAILIGMRSRYPSILGLRQLLQEVHRGIFAHHPLAYRTAQDEQ